MSKIAVDCDGVLADFVRAFNIEAGLDPDYQPTGWDWSGILTKAQADATRERMMSTENGWLTLSAIRENVSALARWLAATRYQDVWIMTSRWDTPGLTTAKQTELWLYNCGVRSMGNHLGVIVVPYSEDKVDICSRLGIDWMVDDKLETIEAFDNFPYLHGALLDLPHNRQREVKWRVKNVGEFLDKVK